MLNRATEQGAVGPGTAEKIPDERNLMPAYHEEVESILIVYDLSDASQWSLAGQCVCGWGRERVVIYSLDAERVVVEFKPGGAADLRELA